MSPQDSPSLLSQGYVDHSHHEAYTNRGNHASGQGVININHLHPDPPADLREHCSPSAAFDSAARFDPPRCAESTRLGIIQTIEEWVNSDGDTAVPSSLFWLYGGAGVGKSALAQSLSETFQRNRRLAASFFFFRSDPTRNKGELLIPTLVSHLVYSLKGLEFARFVENRIHDNPAVFTKRCETQVQELLIEPLLALKSTGALVTDPQLIVIDGLDECEGTDVQCELLRVIARAIPQIPYPLRFLITSRPEAHIKRVFNHDVDVLAISPRGYNLSEDPDADMDIRNFLDKEFMEIRRIHSIGQHLPDAWPDENAISSLVERSSGHFIYASTVIRYIRSPKHRPDNRLEVILRLRPPREGDQPYAQLDGLYTFIFQGVENCQLKMVCLVLGILLFQCRGAGIFSRLTAEQAINLIEMEVGDLILLLDPILSLLSIDGDQVRVYHKSLFDYLLDFTRGGHLPCDFAQVHELAATYILKERIMKNINDVYDLEYFAYHCQYAHLNDALKDYLHSLEVPYPKSVFTCLSGDRLIVFLESSLRHLFRTLSREDFDSTGQISKQYAAKWMSYFYSAGRGYREPIRSLTVANVSSGLKRSFGTQRNGANLNVMDGLKRQLDTLLTEWKPPKVNPMNAGMSPIRRVAYIEGVHSVISASAKAAFACKEVISSLVTGKDFIHSYHLGVSNADLVFLILQTYSRHGNVSCSHVRLWALGDVTRVVWQTKEYLSSIGNFHFSDLCQKYGL